MIPSIWESGRAGTRFPSIAAFPRWRRSPASPTGRRLPRPRPAQCASQGQTPIFSPPSGQRGASHQNLIEICVRTCDMNSTLGSVVLLAMFSWCLVEVLMMKCNQDLCLHLWYDLKKLLWQNKHNPWVSCAFGNVCEPLPLHHHSTTIFDYMAFLAHF